MIDRFDLTGRVAIITGDGTRIGWATELMRARRGADVVLAARLAEPLRSTADEITTLGRRVGLCR